MNTLGMSYPHNWLTLGGFLGVQVDTLEVGVLVNTMGMSHSHNWLTLGGILNAQVGVLVKKVGMSYPHALLTLVGFRVCRWRRLRWACW